MPRALFLSPHLDDVVFSCGGLAASLADAGWDTVLVTAFTRSVVPASGFALACQLDKGLPPDIDYMAQRRDEDREAAAILGFADMRWLDLLEAPHRGYDSAALPVRFRPRRRLHPGRTDGAVPGAVGGASARPGAGATGAGQPRGPPAGDRRGPPQFPRRPARLLPRHPLCHTAARGGGPAVGAAGDAEHCSHRQRAGPQGCRRAGLCQPDRLPIRWACTPCAGAAGVRRPGRAGSPGGAVLRKVAGRVHLRRVAA